MHTDLLGSFVKIRLQCSRLDRVWESAFLTTFQVRLVRWPMELNLDGKGLPYWKEELIVTPIFTTKRNCS